MSVASGESEGDDLEHLIEDHKVALYRYVSRRVSPADADDVVAEVLVAAWRHRHALPPHVDLWLYRTAWNAMLHQFRSARRRNGLVQRLIATREITVEAPPADTAEPPLVEVLRHAMPRLSPADQELLRMTYWEGLSAADAAFVLGSGTDASIRVRLHRARKRLAVEIAREQRQLDRHSCPDRHAGPPARPDGPIRPDGSPA